MSRIRKSAHTSTNASDRTASITSAASPYYPPRAGRTRYLFRAVDGFRLLFHRSQLGESLSVDLPPAQFLGYCLVPGLGFRIAGWDQLARLALSAWFISLVIYFLWIGRGVATLAFGVMLSIHATSMACAVSRAWPQRLLVTRLLIALTIVVGLNQFAYGPALNILERSSIMPIWHQGGLYVINRTPWRQELRRGDLVAYRIHATGGTARVREGTGLDQVIGLPGDVIEFSRTEIRVNGMSHPKREYMPSYGRLIIPPDYWFVWPTLRRTMHGEVYASAIGEALLDTGTIAREDILGKPFGFRLWRHQNQ